MQAMFHVSILVLMDSRIKIWFIDQLNIARKTVSILVLMDSRIKIVGVPFLSFMIRSFNPCFNG